MSRTQVQEIEPLAAAELSASERWRCGVERVDG